MRSFIIGTAGHIDHGKSSLVRALTGTDPDRLKEEKERGITIDLGFAHAPLSEDVVASFIDVPGHEKFVRRMVAGSHGIDAVLLVVDVNESVMPQTREHFEICRILGIERGVIALTKADLGEPAATPRTEAAVRALVRGSFLEGAAVIPVSSTTGEGLEVLRAALLALARETGARSHDGPLRLPIDRVFTLRGFGTVVTGTLASGVLNVGDDVVILPSGRKSRVRGLQTHGAPVERAIAGERTAVNLTNTLIGEIDRGEVLLCEGTLRATNVAQVRLRLLDGRSVRHGARVRVNTGSAEILGRVRLAEDQAGDAAEVFAEIRFESEVVLARGDRLVIRRYSPVETIGGAIVLDPAPRVSRRSGLAALSLVLAETEGEAAARFVRETAAVGLRMEELASRLGLTLRGTQALVVETPGVLILDGAASTGVDETILVQLEASAEEEIRRAHRKDPLARGLSREELRRRVFEKSASGLFELILSRLVVRGVIREAGDLVALNEHRVVLSPHDEAARVDIERALSEAGLSGLSLPDLHSLVRHDKKACESAVRVLVQEKAAERVGSGLLLARSALDRFRGEARARFSSGAKLDVGEVKEWTGLSRKYVIPLLEWLDRERVTRRVGATRIVL